MEVRRLYQTLSANRCTSLISNKRFKRSKSEIRPKWANGEQRLAI